MTTYILKRILITIPLLLGITVIIFSLIHLAPGDPVTGMIDPTLGTLSAEAIAQERSRLGLDMPLPLQYAAWLGRMVRGDLGYSLVRRSPVTELIGQRIESTLQLTVSALALAVVAGVSIGIVSAVKQYSWIDSLFTFLSFGAVSVPGFFLALGLIYILALNLQLLPTSGMRTLGAPPSLWDRVRHMIMPVSVLAVTMAADLVRYTRSSVLEVLGQEYLTVARAKGVRELLVVLRHGLPNALIPVITIIGLRLPALFGGSIIIEQIFHWPGIGTLNIWAVQNSDYMVLMGLNLVSAILILFANLLTDIVYAFVDPRVRYD